MDVKVPRSHSKRCALEQEQVKRIKIEQEYKDTKEKVPKLDKMVLTLLKHQITEEIISSIELDDENKKNANNQEFEEDDVVDEGEENEFEGEEDEDDDPYEE